MKNKCKFGRDKCILYVRWIVNSHCNGKFNDIFEVMDNLKFVNSYEEIGLNIPKYIASDNIISIYKNYYGEEINHVMECNIFGILKFNSEIKSIAKDFINKNFGKKTIGLHIRRTDDVHAAKRWGNYSSDELFHKIIKDELDKNSETKFYLSTDNDETQNIFKESYPKNIIYYKKIDKSDNLRQTLLKDAGVDLYLLSRCHHVEGSFHSTFTRIAVLLNLNFRNENEKAEEELDKYFFRKKK
jgi:hypothetical protein